MTLVRITGTSDDVHAGAITWTGMTGGKIRHSEVRGTALNSLQRRLNQKR
jgi:hypothetical protein